MAPGPAVPSTHSCMVLHSRPGLRPRGIGGQRPPIGPRCIWVLSCAHGSAFVHGTVTATFSTALYS